MDYYAREQECSRDKHKPQHPVAEADENLKYQALSHHKTNTRIFKEVRNN